MNYRVVSVGEDIYHHGIKGQKWGVRRYQNKDGSLTAVGKRRYSEDDDGANNDANKSVITSGKEAVQVSLTRAQQKALNRGVREHRVKVGNTIAKVLIGGSLGGLTYSYLKSLGLV